jgi:hypothetical protein
MIDFKKFPLTGGKNSFGKKLTRLEESMPPARRCYFFDRHIDKYIENSMSNYLLKRGK